MRRAAVLLVLALVGSGLVLLARPDEEPLAPDAAASPPAIDLAPSGVVVSLTRSGADLPVGLGASAAFLIGASATEPVDHVELWDGGEVVASYDPPGDRTELEPRLDWTPGEAGRHLVTARAIDRSGRVGLSNPSWLDVTEGQAVTLVVDGAPEGFAPPTGPDTEPPPAVVPAAGRGVRVPRQVDPGLPTVELAVDGCTVDVTATSAAQGPATLVLLMVPPAGSEVVPVAELGEVGTAQTAGLTATLGGGAQALLVAQLEDGAVTGWSAPAVTDPGDDCPAPGWEGPVTLTDGQLHADTDAAEAYLYLEPEPGAWTRVPATGAVPNLGGVFDFGPHLPPLPGGFEVHAWGRGQGGVALIGTATYTPPSTPPTPAVGETVVFGGAILPPTTLRWVTSGDEKALSSLATSGTIDVDPDDDLIGSQEFVWKSPGGGVTHGLVQVSQEALPAESGPGTPLTWFTCLVPGSAGGFTIDFDAETCSPQVEPSAASAQVGSYGNLVPAGGPIPVGPPNVGTKNPLDALEQQIYDDPESTGGDVPWIDQRVVRVLPMTDDSWLGTRSNDVALELDRTPKVPPGEQAYDLDLKLVGAPNAPRYRYMACWQFTGWDDPVAAAVQSVQERQQLLATYGNQPSPALYASSYPHYFWSSYLAANGGGPICAGCRVVTFPGVGVATVGLGGADCSSDSTFWEDPVGWVGSNLVGPVLGMLEDLADLAADGFAYLKSKAVEGLMAITQCTGAFCKTLAEAVVNGALLALGVPPTIPNFDQLVALGKGELVAVAVDLAKAAGVPCDAAGSAATFHGDDDLTCEAAVAALLDEVVTAMNQSFLDTAKSGGLVFADDIRVVPWWAGQPGSATVEVTVNPTKYTAEEQGKTCTAGVLSSSSWTAASTTYPDPDLGPVTIPKTAWSTWPYEVASWSLPTLPKDPKAEHGYAPATKTFYLTPARPLDLVTVHKNIGLGGMLPYKLSQFAFLFHKDATFQIHVGGACATAETHTYTLNGSGGATLVSVVEG